MAVATPIGTPAMVIRITISTIPMMAGKIPPWVIPSRGAWVRNDSDRCGVPFRIASKRIIARIASTLSSVAPEATATAPSANRFRRVRRAASSASAARSDAAGVAAASEDAVTSRFLAAASCG